MSSTLASEEIAPRTEPLMAVLNQLRDLLTARRFSVTKKTLIELARSKELDTTILESATEYELVFALDQLKNSTNPSIEIENWNKQLEAIAESGNPLEELRRVAEDCLGLESVKEIIDIALIDERKKDFINSGVGCFHGWLGSDGFYYLHLLGDTPKQFRVPANVVGQFKSAARVCANRVEILRTRDLWQRYQGRKIEYLQLVAWPDIEKTSFIGYLKRVSDGQILGFYIWSPRELDQTKLRQSHLINQLLEVRQRGEKGKKKAKHFSRLEEAECSATKASRKRCNFEYKCRFQDFQEQIRELRQLSLVQTFGVS